MSAVLRIDEQKISNEELLPLLAKYRLLPQLAKEIIIDQAIATVDLTPEEQANARQQFFDQYKLQSQAQLEAFLQKQNLTIEELQKQVERQYKLKKFKQDTWGHQLESYFLDRKRQLDKIIYSLLRTSDLGIAQELYFRIQEQENTFAELAEQYSLGPEAQTGGLVGPVELSGPHPRIAQMLATSKPGQLLPPARIGNWWVIIRLEKLICAQLDESMRRKLLEEKFTDWLNEELQQKVSFSEAS